MLRPSVETAASIFGHGWADECQAGLDGDSFVPKPRSRLPKRSFDGPAGLFDREPLAVNNRVRLPVGGELGDLCVEHPHEVPAAVLVDDLADDILWITGLRPFHTALDRGLDIRCQEDWRYPALAAAAADSKAASSLALTCVIICGMITSWPLARWKPRHRCRQKPPGIERVAEAVTAAADHGGYSVDIKVEDTGMPVSECACYRRFPDAGRPV